MTTPKRMRLLSTLALAAAAGFGLLSAAPAFAHDAVQSTAPAENATVTAAPGTVSLTMSEPPMNSEELNLSIITVTDATGKALSNGKVAVSGATISTKIDKGSNGPYKVVWRTVSSDGHPIQGSYSFTVQDPSAARTKPGGSAAATSTATVPPAAATPAAEQNPGADSGAATIAVTVGAAALLLAGFLVMRMRKAAGKK
ncbi:copper resistance CopC family protein [Arthrobacter sp. QXT-31]|uniref:copper resistance CopC family protein n=1 Tax=Arthrobacter sp. QXT-31 TaxID=1357915 RepID=UPI0009719A34|nr:copper resistance CopC family protein [Arthrobacter sp. QXT-31]APX00448.1 hypothetical protein BWQ92_00720 [Arthrobacter sp. QXT-31]